ncbi:MAG: hypothetical protein LQ348_000630 [Seirophora lacunosa]|nr:MAG: hypothetical protein LQ344_004479 [Seirophora lacunosa]KAI4207245.1 MAG: hypothetical protein LQ348_000630 [Seirophora lacunosa]
MDPAGWPTYRTAVRHPSPGLTGKRPTSSGMLMSTVSEAQSSPSRKLAPKPPFVRPVQTKLVCPKCDSRPDGYRGEHELRRHMNRAHAQFHKAWKCVDISEDGKFLASCKACRSGKLYGAYYNAAAHLRRRHFAPKPKGSEERVSNESGKQANDSSMSMETLKMWMQEIEVEHGLKEDRSNMENDEQDDANATTMAQRGMPNGKGEANGVNRALQDYDAIDAVGKAEQEEASWGKSNAGIIT